jgi:hypothetical protein
MMVETHEKGFFLYAWIETTTLRMIAADSDGRREADAVVTAAIAEAVVVVAATAVVLQRRVLRVLLTLLLRLYIFLFIWCEDLELHKS